VARAPTAAGAGRGRIGLAGEPAGRLKRARKEKYGRGNLVHHVTKRRASSRAERRRQRRGSTTATARAALRQAGTQAPGAARLRWRLPLVNKHRVRVMIVHGEEKGKATMRFTDGDVCTAAGRSRGGGTGEIGARARVLVCCRGKGRRRGSCASLNRGAGRQAKRGEDGVAGGLPLMAAAITARV
jgi:hypothetical protein